MHSKKNENASKSIQVEQFVEWVVRYLSRCRFSTDCKLWQSCPCAWSMHVVTSSMCTSHAVEHVAICWQPYCIAWARLRFVHRRLQCVRLFHQARLTTRPDRAQTPSGFDVLWQCIGKHAVYTLCHHVDPHSKTDSTRSQPSRVRVVPCTSIATSGRRLS